MNNKIYLLVTILTAGLLIPAYAVQDPIIFPKNGQTKEQKQQDQAYCQTWAKDESGVDPAYVKAKLDAVNDQMANQAATQKGVIGSGKIIRGAAVGAAMGGLDDAIDSEAGAGAAKGAVLMGARGRSQNREAQEKQAVENGYAKKQQLEEEYQKFQRAFSACMEAKGYSVK
jgi:hypothetical protein